MDNAEWVLISRLEARISLLVTMVAANGIATICILLYLLVRLYK